MAESAETGVRLPGRAPKLADQVTEAVHEMVRTGQLQPGELYSVTRIADALGVSRSPVREALLALAAQGMIDFERNRGFRVRLPDPREIAEIFVVRIQLETAAVERAAEVLDETGRAELVRLLARLESMADAGAESEYWTADIELHDRMLHLAGNRRAARLVEELRAETRAIGAGTTSSSRSLAEIAAEHRPVVTALLAGEGGQASAQMRRHLEGTAKVLVAQRLGLTVSDPEVTRIWESVSTP